MALSRGVTRNHGCCHLMVPPTIPFSVTAVGVTLAGNPAAYLYTAFISRVTAFTIVPSVVGAMMLGVV